MLNKWVKYKVYNKHAQHGGKKKKSAFCVFPLIKIKTIYCLSIKYDKQYINVVDRKLFSTTELPIRQLVHDVFTAFSGEEILKIVLLTDLR